MQGRLYIVDPPETEEILHFQSWTKKKYTNVFTDLGVKENFIDYINYDTLELFQVHSSYGMPAISYFGLINNEVSDYFELVSRLSTTDELFWGNTSFPSMNLYLIKTFRINNFIEPDHFNNFIPFLKILATHALLPLEMQHDIESEIQESINEQMIIMDYITLSMMDDPQSYSLETNELQSIEREAIRIWIATLIKNDRFAEANVWLDLFPEITQKHYLSLENIQNKNDGNKAAWKNNSCPNYSITPTSKSIFKSIKSHSDSEIPMKSCENFSYRK